MNITKILTIAAIFTSLAITSGVTNAAASKNLDALLKQVKEGAVKDTKENKARENEFKKNRARQAQLIQQAKAERARLRISVSSLKLNLRATRMNWMSSKMNSKRASVN